MASKGQQPLPLDMNNAVRQCCCSYQEHPYVERQIIYTEILACQDHMQPLRSYYNKTICSTFALLSLRPFFLSMLLHAPQTAFAALASSLHRVMLLAMLRNFSTQKMHQIHWYVHQKGQRIHTLLQPVQMPCSSTTF